MSEIERRAARMRTPEMQRRLGVGGDIKAGQILKGVSCPVCVKELQAIEVTDRSHERRQYVLHCHQCGLSYKPPTASLELLPECCT